MDISGFTNLPRDMKCEISKELTLSEVKALRLTSRDNKSIVEQCLKYLIYDVDQVDTNIPAKLVINLPAVQVIDKQYSAIVDNRADIIPLAEHPNLTSAKIIFDIPAIDKVYVLEFFKYYNIKRDYDFLFKQDSIYLSVSKGIDGLAEVKIRMANTSTLAGFILAQLNRNGLEIGLYQGPLRYIAQDPSVLFKELPNLHTLVLTDNVLSGDLARLVSATKSTLVDTITTTTKAFNKNTSRRISLYLTKARNIFNPHLKRFLPIRLAVYEKDPTFVSRTFPNLEIFDIDVTEISEERFTALTNKLEEEGKLYQLWFAN